MRWVHVLVLGISEIDMTRRPHIGLALVVVILGGCASHEPKDGGVLSMVIWPKIETCDFASPDREHAVAINYIDLPDRESVRGARPPLEIEYASARSEPINPPELGQTYCVSLQRLHWFFRSSDADYGLEVQAVGPGQVHVTPQSVLIRHPIVAGRRTQAQVTIFLTPGRGQPKDTGVSTTFNLGDFPTSNVALPSSAMAQTIVWPGEVAQLSAHFVERSSPD
jgi:hypothetical protein